MTTGIAQVHTTLPDAGAAQVMAAMLLEERLAACVQIAGPIASSYWWQGKVERAEEWLLLIKTTEELVPRLLTRIRELHRYDTPEVIVVPVIGGDEKYLAWVRGEVRGEK